MPALAASAFHSLRLDAVPDQEALRRADELPSHAAVRKQMIELTEQTRRLIACSSLVLVASVDAEGTGDRPYGDCLSNRRKGTRAYGAPRQRRR